MVWYQRIAPHVCQGVGGGMVVWYGYHTMVPPYHMYHIDRHGTHIQYPYQLAPARHQCNCNVM